jgi:hypothetical protein
MGRARFAGVPSTTLRTGSSRSKDALRMTAKKKDSGALTKEKM